MLNIIEVKTKDQKLIRLTLTQWKHIVYRHPEMSSKLIDIENMLLYPSYIKDEEEIKKYYKYIKDIHKYIMVAIRILNGDGFVMTSYLTRKI